MVMSEAVTDAGTAGARSPARHRGRVWSFLLWLLVALLAAWAAVRLFGMERGFPAVQLIAFTPYVVLASLVPMVAAILTKRIWPAVAAMLVTIALAACVVPRWVADQNPDPVDGPTLRVLSANLLIGGADVPRLVSLTRSLRVDVLALQEYTAESGRALRAGGLAELLPHRVEYPLPGVGGSAIYSRLPLTDRGLRLHDSGFGQARAAIAVPAALAVHVESVHPCAPSGPDRSSCWVADLANQPPASLDGPIQLLLGDFNATLDHAALRRLLDTGYRDAAEVAGAGMIPSWPFDERWYIPGVALDHVLADRRVGVKSVSLHTIPHSDHRAIFAELVLPAG